MAGWVIAIILGVVEGLTEFIPVSSTGHLIVAGHLLGFVGDRASAFEVSIQFGAVLAVVALYRDRFTRLIPRRGGAASPKSALDGWSGLCRISVASLPALIAGFVAHDFVKLHLFTPPAVAAALFLGGIGILIAERHVRRRAAATVDTLSLGQALSIGLFQVFALWPGTSRSAATIIGGLLVGLDRKGAAEFSFLIAVPLLAAATGYDLLNLGPTLTAAAAREFVLGFGVSFLVALVTVRGFLRMLNRWTLAPFAWYRIAAAPLFYWVTGGLNF